MATSDKNEEDNGLIAYLFETNYIAKDPDIRLTVVGSAECVGNWNIQNSRMARECPKRSGKWLADVFCLPDTKFEWKWALVLQGNLDVVRWEERPNRSFEAGRCPGRVLAPWNGGTEFIVTTGKKFKHKGVDEIGDETDEEWSYLPSPEIMETLKEGEIDILIPEDEKENTENELRDKNRKKRSAKTTCVNRWTREAWSGKQTDTGLGISLENASTKHETVPKTIEAETENTSDQNDKSRLVKSSVSQATMTRIRGFINKFCTIL